MVDTVVISKEQWVIIGENSSDTLLVKAGQKPICIRVQSPDSGHIRQLVEAANRGLALGLDSGKAPK